MRGMTHETLFEGEGWGGACGDCRDPANGRRPSQFVYAMCAQHILGCWSREGRGLNGLDSHEGLFADEQEHASSNPGLQSFLDKKSDEHVYSALYLIAGLFCIYAAFAHGQDFCTSAPPPGIEV